MNQYKPEYQDRIAAAMPAGRSPMLPRTLECAVCGAVYVAVWARTCSARCRKRLQRAEYAKQRKGPQDTPR